jgi:hypothetical protein
MLIIKKAEVKSTPNTGWFWHLELELLVAGGFRSVVIRRLEIPQNLQLEGLKL